MITGVNLSAIVTALNAPKDDPANRVMTVAGSGARATSLRASAAPAKGSPLQTTTVTIRNKLGLHARPSALLSKTANLYASSVTLSCGARSVDAKSILGLHDDGDALRHADHRHRSSATKREAIRIVELFEERFGESE